MFVEQAYKGSEHDFRTESNTQLFAQETQNVGSVPQVEHAAFINFDIKKI